MPPGGPPQEPPRKRFRREGWDQPPPRIFYREPIGPPKLLLIPPLLMKGQTGYPCPKQVDLLHQIKDDLKRCENGFINATDADGNPLVLKTAKKSKKHNKPILAPPPPVALNPEEEEIRRISRIVLLRNDLIELELKIAHKKAMEEAKANQSVSQMAEAPNQRPKSPISSSISNTETSASAPATPVPACQVKIEEDPAIKEEYPTENEVPMSVSPLHDNSYSTDVPIKEEPLDADEVGFKDEIAESDETECDQAAMDANIDSHTVPMAVSPLHDNSYSTDVPIKEEPLDADEVGFKDEIADSYETECDQAAMDANIDSHTVPLAVSPLYDNSYSTDVPIKEEPLDADEDWRDETAESDENESHQTATNADVDSDTVPLAVTPSTMNADIFAVAIKNEPVQGAEELQNEFAVVAALSRHQAEHDRSVGFLHQPTVETPNEQKDLLAQTGEITSEELANLLQGTPAGNDAAAEQPVPIEKDSAINATTLPRDKPKKKKNQKVKIIRSPVREYIGTLRSETAKVSQLLALTETKATSKEKSEKNEAVENRLDFISDSDDDTYVETDSSTEEDEGDDEPASSSSSQTSSGASSAQGKANLTLFDALCMEGLIDPTAPLPPPARPRGGPSYCAKCRNHGDQVPRKGHRNLCPYMNCQCERCELTDKCNEVNRRRREFAKEGR